MHDSGVLAEVWSWAPIGTAKVMALWNGRGRDDAGLDGTWQLRDRFDGRGAVEQDSRVCRSHHVPWAQELGSVGGKRREQETK